MQFLAQQCPWYLAGILIGLLAAGMQWTANLPLGATGAVVGVTSWVGNPSAGPGWRVFFFIGIVLGAFAHAMLSGTFAPSFAHGGFDARFGAALDTKAPLLLGAGLLIGFGARWAGGCTSGHGICGMSRLSPGSLAATMTFVGTAVVVAQIITRTVGGP